MPKKRRIFIEEEVDEEQEDSGNEEGEEEAGVEEEDSADESVGEEDDNDDAELFWDQTQNSPLNLIIIEKIRMGYFRLQQNQLLKQQEQKVQESFTF